MKYIVHLKEKTSGKIEVEAENKLVAIQTTKRMIARNEIPDRIMDESEGIVVKYVEEGID